MNPISFSSLDLAPEEAGIYFLYSSDKDLLYIGRASNIHRRLVSHLNSEKKDKIAYFSYEIHRTGISLAEKNAIEQYSKRTGSLPPLNRISGFV